MKQYIQIIDEGLESRGDIVLSHRPLPRLHHASHNFWTANTSSDRRSRDDGSGL
jgi:hypothetical protein